MSAPSSPLFNRIPPWLRVGWGIFGFLSAPLKTRLIKGLGIMLLPLLILGTISYYNLRSLDTTFRDLIDEITVEMEMFHLLRLHTVQAALTVRYYTPGADDNSFVEWDLSQTISAIDAITKRFDPNKFALDEEDRLVNAILTEWQTIRYDGLTLAAAGQSSAAKDSVLRSRFLNGLTTVNRQLKEVHDLAEREIQEDIREFAETRRKTEIVTLALFGGSLAIAVIAGVLLAGSILRPLHRLEESAQSLGRGDLSVRIEAEGQDELSLLMRTFNRMAEDLERAHHSLTELTIRDPLTGLYNRREFDRKLIEEIGRSVRYKRPLALFTLDLDHFKQVNDRYGHPAGDEALRQVANLLRASLRRVDILFRIGGEEFVALLPESSQASAVVLAERLRRTLEGTPLVLPEGTEIAITISIGVALYPNHATDAPTLLRLADEALYRAKESGRNRVCSAPESV